MRELLRGAADDVVIEIAVRENRILLTEDKDFGQLVHAQAANPPSVIFIRFPGNARQALTEAIKIKGAWLDFLQETRQ